MPGSTAYFWYLFQSAIEITLFLVPFVWMPVLAAAYFLAAWGASRIDRVTRPQLVRLACAALIQAAIPVLTLVAGVAFVNARMVSGFALKPWFKGVSVHQAESVLLGLDLLLAVSAIASLWFCRKTWQLSVASSLFWCVCSFGAGVVTQMSITGMWL
jgi:hypothetical protein